MTAAQNEPAKTLADLPEPDPVAARRLLTLLSQGGATDADAA